MLFKHIKTGKIYSVTYFNIINATNGHENDEPMVLYSNGTDFFVRSKSEFNEKFENISVNDDKEMDVIC